MKAVTRITFFDDNDEKFFGEGPCHLLHAINSERAFWYSGQVLSRYPISSMVIQSEETLAQARRKETPVWENASKTGSIRFSAPVLSG